MITGIPTVLESFATGAAVVFTGFLSCSALSTLASRGITLYRGYFCGQMESLR